MKKIVSVLIALVFLLSVSGHSASGDIDGYNFHRSVKVDDDRIKYVIKRKPCILRPRFRLLKTMKPESILSTTLLSYS